MASLILSLKMLVLIAALLGLSANMPASADGTYWCSPEKFEDGSAYASNLEDVLSQLRQGYTTGQRINPDVYASTQCTSSQDVCIACVNQKIDTIQSDCGNSFGAYLFQSDCGVQYLWYQS